VIVPDDPLWRLPFEALPVADAPLSAAVRVSYATSLTTLSVQRKLASLQPGAPKPTAALFAASVIPDAIRTQITLAQPAWKEPDAQAMRTGAEAIRSSYGETSTLQTGADATETAVRTAFDASDILSMSVPFQVSGATPLFSYLAFTGSGDAPQADGRWEVREWFGASSRARVLVLADASSLGSSGAGGALDLIAWAAAAAGVPAVVVARAPADGFAIDEVLTAFHAALGKGTGVEEAWSRAVAAARERKSDAPSDWTGARLIGAGR
jgi:hypothetical protein